MGHWTIAELAERAAAVLARDDRTRTLDARTRGVPDPRTIRWYQTTGLIDRPSTMRGRTALYGERHLAQLVAIKRLQAEGRSLAAIQAELAGASDEVLRRLAALPKPGRPDGPGGLDVPGSPGATPATHAQPAGIRPRFWTDRAAAPPADLSAGVDAQHVETHRQATAPTAEHTPAADGIHGLRLAPGVVLLLEGGRAPDGADTKALLRAAEPLLTELTSRALLEEER